MYKLWQISIVCISVMRFDYIWVSISHWEYVGILFFSCACNAYFGIYLFRNVNWMINSLKSLVHDPHHTLGDKEIFLQDFLVIL